MILVFIVDIVALNMIFNNLPVLSVEYPNIYLTRLLLLIVWVVSKLLLLISNTLLNIFILKTFAHFLFFISC